jgi:hypothetical protein
MLTDEIGFTAGKVWQLLDTKGEMSVAAVKKAIGIKDFTVDWAIGWLAREDKLVFRKEKNIIKLGLKA